MVQSKTPELVVGFVGLPCAGKGTAIDFLVSNYGFFYTSTSDQIRRELKKNGEDISRESLQRVGGELRKKYGGAVLAERTWGEIIRARPDKAVVDSIRGIEEVRFLKRQPHFYLVAVSASDRIRFERMRERNRSGDPESWAEFLAVNRRDLRGDGRNMRACIDSADFKIENDGSLAKLEKRLARWIQQSFGIGK